MPAVPPDGHHGAPVRLGCGPCRFEIGRQRLGPVGKQPRPSDQDRVVVDDALHPEPLHAGEPVDPGKRSDALGRGRRDGPGDRVFRGRLERTGAT